ncbi:AzlD domain-containing protein [Alicyclobacillus kakegawensis]|uniref:AzlD domain-containing protein n=1 Tax=Alicyclobacillus kakegawensis TaxID=392012 RepID=UPI00082A35D9|nr:AzlD domain-containing protein [Alicyclobacillus kakegawensis]
MHPLFWEVLCVGLGTYLIRAVSLSFGSRLVWPGWLKRVMAFVTPAVLGALVGPMLWSTGASVAPWRNPALWAAIPTVLAAWWTRQLLWTVGVGVAAYALAGVVSGRVTLG